MDTPQFRTPLRPASASSSSRRALHPRSSEHLATPSRSSPLARPPTFHTLNPALVTPNHSASRYPTSAYPSPKSLCSSSNSHASTPTASASAASALEPILIPTPKLGRFLRPLRAKLAHFRQAASSAPQAHRELVEPPTPSHRPIPRRSAALTSHSSSSQSASSSPNAPAPVAITYALRKSTRAASSSAPLAQPAAPSISVSQLLFSVTASLAAGRRAPPAPTRIPTPLRPSIASIQEAYRDVVYKTWRQHGQQGVLGQQDRPLSLVDLAAFKLGELIADQCEDEQDAVDELEAVYADLPVHLRSRVFLQHATRLCISSAHEPSILCGLAQTAFNSATRHQFVALATAAVAADPAKVTLDVLTTIVRLAAKCGCLEGVLVPMIDALTVQHVLRSTFVLFARWAMESTELAAVGQGSRWDLAVPGMVAARMVQVVVQADAVGSDIVLGHLVEYVKVFVGTAAKVFAAETEGVQSSEGGTGEVMPSVWTSQLVVLAEALSSPQNTRVPTAITYPISVALLTLAASSPNRALAHIPAQLSASLPVLPRASSSLIDANAHDSDSDSPVSSPPSTSDNNLLILYQVTQPNFWLEAALALYSAANARAHALTVARYLLADMQDGDARCALETHELAAWVCVIEKELAEAELEVCCHQGLGSKTSRGQKSRDFGHANEQQAIPDQRRANVMHDDDEHKPTHHHVPPTPSTATDSLSAATPLRLPPPPILTPTTARNTFPNDLAPWYLTPVSTHSHASLSISGYPDDEVPDFATTPCVSQTNARASKRLTSSENQHHTSTRPDRQCRKRERSRSEDLVQPPVHTDKQEASSRKAARTRTRTSATAKVLEHMGSRSDNEQDQGRAALLTSAIRDAKSSRVEIVEPLSETDEPDEFLMM